MGDMTTMAPDTTLQRYSVEALKNTSAKRVPFEELDFTIYKPNANHVAFSTNEARLPLWIKALYLRYYACQEFNDNAGINITWLEQVNPNNAAKSDKIKINILVNNIESVLTITVNISVGRIEVKGRHFKEWGTKEFDNLLAMVNTPDETWNVESIKPFIKIVQCKEKQSQQSSTPMQTPTKKPEENMTEVTPREKSFSLMKSQLAKLEAEFILYKENNQRTISELSDSIEKKDEEINCLRNDIQLLKSTDKAKQQIISDLTLKQLQMEQDINSVNKRCKKVEEKNLNLLKSISTKQKESEAHSEIPTWASISTTNPANSCSIPTSNSFEPLSKDSNGCDETMKIQTDKTEENPQATYKDSPQPKTDSPQSKEDNPQAKKNDSQPKKNNPQPDDINLPTKADEQPGDQNIASTHKPNDAETIILCDSNGRYLKPKLLCPDSTTSYIRCPTLTKVRHIIQNTNFTNPKTFIIHCGTNDIEQLPPDQNLVTEINDIISSIRGKYPQSRIIISALLPRKDELNKLIPPINHGIEKALHTIPNTSFIHHNNINIDKDLHDKKHLNDKGVKVFAKNIKATYFNTTPKKRNFPNFSQQQKHPVTYNNQPNPFSSGYHYPPFIPTFKLPPTNMNAQPNTNMSSHQFSQRKPSTMSLPPQLIELIKQLYGCIN